MRCGLIDVVIIIKIRVLGVGVLIRLPSWEVKRFLITNKDMLRGAPISIKDHLTRQEIQVQEWIE